MLQSWTSGQSGSSDFLKDFMEQDRNQLKSQLQVSNDPALISQFKFSRTQEVADLWKVIASPEKE